MSSKIRILRLFFLASIFSPIWAHAETPASLWNAILAQDQTQWTDEAGNSIKLKDLSNSKHIILTAFYTHCSRTCPELTFKILKKIEAKFHEKNLEVEFILVTLEPEIDTPQVLSQFKQRVAPDRKHWHLLRADSAAQVRDFVQAAALGDFWKMDDHTLHEFKILYFDSESKIIKKLDFKHQDVETLLTP